MTAGVMAEKSAAKTSGLPSTCPDCGAAVTVEVGVIESAAIWFVPGRTGLQRKTHLGRFAACGRCEWIIEC